MLLGRRRSDIRVGIGRDRSPRQSGVSGRNPTIPAAGGLVPFSTDIARPFPSDLPDVMHRIPAKLPAMWLLVLIVLPCTAPFSTRDWRDLFGLAGACRASSQPCRKPVASQSVLDHALTHPSALRVTVGRLRLPRLSLLPVALIVPFARVECQRRCSELEDPTAPSPVRPVLRI
jgi:hypothetical protein